MLEVRAWSRGHPPAETIYAELAGLYSRMGLATAMMATGRILIPLSPVPDAEQSSAPRR